MIGPLFIGLIADAVSFRAAFLTVVALLAIGAVMVIVFGTETHARGKSAPASERV